MRGAPTAAAVAEAEAEGKAKRAKKKKKKRTWNRYGLANGDKRTGCCVGLPSWFTMPDAKYSIQIKTVVGRIRFAGGGGGEVARQMKRRFDESRQTAGEPRRSNVRGRRCGYCRLGGRTVFGPRGPPRANPLGKEMHGTHGWIAEQCVQYSPRPLTMMKIRTSAKLDDGAMPCNVECVPGQLRNRMRRCASPGGGTMEKSRQTAAIGVPPGYP